MKAFRFFLVIGCFFLSQSLIAQSSLPQIEDQLKKLAEEILNHDSLDYKVKQNKVFTKKLIATLKRPESFSYPFKTLRTVSILSPADNSFRIFTWHIVDRKRDTYYGEEQHYYFGLVQRKYTHPNGRKEYIVVPLLEMQKAVRGVENMMLNDANWLGAQYYPIRGQSHIPSYTMKYYGKTNLDGKQKKLKKTFYVLLGWNGADSKSNYKVVDLLSFDDDDPYSVNFGADVFYFDMIPKFRAVFYYSETAPFSLNFDMVRTGPFKLFKKSMIVYDHLSSPNNAGRELKAFWDLGPDGSYDALNFYKTRGYFEWYRNVETAQKLSKEAKDLAANNQERILRAKLAELKAFAQTEGNDELVAEIEALERKPKLGKKVSKLMRKRENQVLQDQENLGEVERRKQKALGIN